MLCRIGKPFDAADHLFEVKWDGIRALAFVDGGAHGWRLHSRHRVLAMRAKMQHRALRRLAAHDFHDALGIDPRALSRRREFDSGSKGLGELGELDRGPGVQPDLMQHPHHTFCTLRHLLWP